MATRRLSSTVRSGSRRRPSGTIATPAARICSGRSLVRLVPFSRHLAAGRLAARRRPRAPSSTCRRRSGRAVSSPAPCGTSSEMPWRTGWPPRETFRPSIVSFEASLASRPRRSTRSSHASVPEVGAHHVLVAEHVRGRAGGDQLAEVDDRGRLRSTPTRGSCRGRRGSRARRTRRGSSGSPRPRCPSPRPAARRPARRGGRAVGLPTTARAISTSRRSRAPRLPTFAFGDASARRTRSRRARRRGARSASRRSARGSSPRCRRSRAARSPSRSGTSAAAPSAPAGSRPSSAGSRRRR